MMADQRQRCFFDAEAQSIVSSRCLDLAERQILQALATGISSAEVARGLGVPIGEVRDHVRSAITKLGAGSRLEALIIAIRHGLIEPPPA